MGFSLKRAFKIPRAVRKWQPLKSPIVRGLALGAAGIASGGLVSGAIAAGSKIGARVTSTLDKGQELGARIQRAGSALAGVGRGVQGAVTSFRDETAAGAVGAEAGATAGGTIARAAPWILGGLGVLAAVFFLRKRR